MPGKRAAGEGTLFQRRMGKYTYWVTRVRLPDGSLSRQITGKTQSEVISKRDALLRQAARTGRTPRSPRGGETTGEFLARWIEGQKPPILRASTWRSYETKVRLYMLPHIGSIPLTKLTPDHIQALQASLLRLPLEARVPSAKGARTVLSPTTVRDVRMILSRALDRAVLEHKLDANPATATLVDRPRTAVIEQRALDPGQALLFLETLRGHRLEALYAVALALGLRKGEALGLSWRDVDLEAGLVHVRRSLSDAGGLHLDDVKTRKSRRTLPLPAFLVPILRRHHGRQAAERERAANLWSGAHDLVFTTQFGTPIGPRNASRDLAAILARTALPRVTFHELRHSCGSLLLALGVDIKVIQEILGHSSIGVTGDVYAHVQLGLKRQAAEAMHGLLGEGAEPAGDRLVLTQRRSPRRAGVG
jgi:integrase